MQRADDKPRLVDSDSSNFVQLILDPPFLRHRIWFPYTAALWGVAVFALGWLLARQISFAEDYLATRAIQVACLNIAWVLGSVFWGLRWLPRLIDSLEKCFADVRYGEFASKWKARFCSDGWMLLSTLAVFAFGAIPVYLGMFRPASKVGHHVFPSSWFQGDLNAKFALLLTIGFCASVATGSGMSLFVVNLPFVSALRKLPVVSLPNLLLAKFRPLSDFYVAGTLAWFIAVGLTAFILFPNLSNAAIWFLLVTTLIGLSGFIVPQVVFHVLVVRAQAQMADYVYDALQHWDKDPSSLKELNEAVKANSMWVFDRADITSLLIPELVTIVGLILKSGVVGQHP